VCVFPGSRLIDLCRLACHVLLGRESRREKVLDRLRVADIPDERLREHRHTAADRHVLDLGAVHSGETLAERAGLAIRAIDRGVERDLRRAGAVQAARGARRSAGAHLDAARG